MAARELSKQQLEQLRRLCREAGIKLTHQRLEIFKEIFSGNDHPSAEQVYIRLHREHPTIAIDTVYRTLATFDELGLVKKLHVMHERTLFDTNLDVHHHFICTHCKKVEDIYWPEFDTAMLPEIVGHKGTVQSRHLEVHGICNSCLDKTEKQQIVSNMLIKEKN